MSNPKKSKLIQALKLGMVVDADPQYTDYNWKILEHAIHRILYYPNTTSGLSFDHLYRGAYNMVVRKLGENLYSGLVMIMTAHLKEISKTIEAAHGDSFLEDLNRKWTEHTEALQIIGDILRYMDRTFVPCTRKAPVYELGLNLWRESVIHSDNLNTRLLNTLFELILKERTGDAINRGVVRNIIKMLLDLGSSAYQEDFETPFLEVSADFYRAESLRCIECCDCGSYLKRAERRLSEEADRVSHYLDAKSESKITSVVEKEMIVNHVQRLVHMEGSGLVSTFLDDKYEDIRRMYELLGRVPDGISTIKDVMTSHIREIGKKLATDPERVKDPVKFVRDLMDARDKYYNIVTLGFNNDMSLVDAFFSSFEHFINLDPRAPELISLFLDHKLRKGLEDASGDDVEIMLNKVTTLIHYLQDKDLFEKYYKKHLARRLLSGKTVYEDAERSVIRKLKAEFGNQLGSKLQGMFKDMKTSEDIMEGFYNSLGGEAGEGRKLSVHVLMAGSWTTQSSPPCNLPAELSELCDKFKSYYLGICTGRKMSWHTSMGTADLTATFGQSRMHELNVSVHQMCVLMLFNNADRLSYKEIEQATEIPALELKRCLQSLACVKGKNVLRKQPMSKSIDENDIFLFNDKFTSKLYKVKIGMVAAQEETEPERKETRQRVEEHRRPQIEAAIVRMMKARKVLDHSSIVAEVTKQLQCRFLANAVQIKRCIESLVEREFLERDSADMKLFRYLP